MTTHDFFMYNGGMSKELSQSTHEVSEDEERKVDPNKRKRNKDERAPKETKCSKMTDINVSNTKTQGYQNTMFSYRFIKMIYEAFTRQIQSSTPISISGEVTESKTAKDLQTTTESPPKQEHPDYTNSDIDEQQRKLKNKETIIKNKGNQLKATKNERNILKLTSHQDKKIDGAKQKHESLSHSPVVTENSEISKDIYTQHTRTTSRASKNGKKINNNDINMTQNGTSESKKAIIESAHNQNKTTTDSKSLPMHNTSIIDRSSQNKKVDHTGMEKKENMPISDSSKKRKTNSKNDKKLTDNSLKDSNKDKSDSTSNHENKTKDTNCSQINNTSNTEISTEKKDVEILEKDKHKEKPLFEASENNQTTESNEADTTKSCPTQTINFVEEVKREGLDLCKAAISDTLIYSIYSILDEIAKNGLKDFNFSNHLKRSFWELWNSLKYGFAEGLFTICCNWVATKSVKLAQAKTLGGKLGISELKKVCDDLYEGRKTKWQIFIEVVKKILVKVAFFYLNYLITSSFGPLGYFSGLALSVGLGVVKKYVNELVI